MVWQPYWIYPKPLKIISRTAGQMQGKLHKYVPQALGYIVANLEAMITLNIQVLKLSYLGMCFRDSSPSLV